MAADSAGRLAELLASLSAADFLIVGLLIALIVISIVGNCLVCVAIFTERRLRKLGNAFIVSLAIADLFVSCLVMTFALCNDLMQYWIFGEWFCDVWISFDIMCSTASILNLCAISLDRFVHIKDCLLYNRWMTRRVAISAVMIIWFISALVSFVPINLGWHRPDHRWLAPSSSLAAPPAAMSPAPDTSNWPRDHDHERPRARRRRMRAGGHFAPPLASSSGAGDGDDLRHSAAAAASLAQFNQVESNPQDGSSAGQIGKLNLSARRRRRAEASGRQLKLIASRPASATIPAGLAPLEASAFATSAANANATTTTTTATAASAQQLPTCALTLTPTYAIISSSISFYIPCIIMLGLYTKLFACARRHVRNIQAVSKAPAPIPASRSMVQLPSELAGAAFAASEPPTGQQPASVRTWLKLAIRRKSPCKSASSSNNNNNNNKIKPNAQSPRSSREDEAHKPITATSARTRHHNQLRAARKSSSESKLTLDSCSTTTPAATLNSGRPPEVAAGDELRPFIQQRAPTQPAAVTAATSAVAAAAAAAAAPSQGNKTISFAPISSGNNINSNSIHLAASSNQQAAAANQVATHKAAMTLGIIMGTFLCCWVPFFCLNIIKSLCVDCIPGSLFRAFTWLGYANSALNPVIYGIHNTEFRQAFNRIFFKHLNIKNSRYYLNRRLSYEARLNPRANTCTARARQQQQQHHLKSHDSNT